MIYVDLVGSGRDYLYSLGVAKIKRRNDFSLFHRLLFHYQLLTRILLFKPVHYGYVAASKIGLIFCGITLTS